MHGHDTVLGYLTCKEQQMPLSAEYQAAVGSCGMQTGELPVPEVRLLPVSQNKVWCRAVLTGLLAW